jgi:hypothetical protein
MNGARKLALSAIGGCLTLTASGQVPDLLTALDVGGRAMGAGGALYATGADTLSSFYNPAGLGFINERTVGVAYRNLPSSRTLVRESFDEPELESVGRRGGNSITHVGVAIPRAGGTVGVSYTLGGYVDDFRTGNNLPTGSLVVRNYQERIRARSDYLTIAFGRTNEAQNLSFGSGIQIVRQGIVNQQQGDLFDDTNNLVGTLDADVTETGTGYGFIAGVQFIPPNRPNISLGASFRTQINIQGNPETAALYDRIPARLLVGAASRQDGLRGDRDFIVYGAQIQHFFGGQRSALLDRTNQTVAGFGFEYHYALGGAMIPIRLGYNMVPSGGSDFGGRNAFTFGLGYRPAGGLFAVDFNFAAPERGGNDLSVGITYRFGS